MKFPCTVEQLGNGRWLIRCTGPGLGTAGSRSPAAIQVTAASREEALRKMRAELHYRTELCPCTGVPAEYVELEVEPAAAPWLARGTRETSREPRP